MACLQKDPELNVSSTGPIVYLTVVGQPVVVLNTLRAAANLLDRKADIYSDRYILSSNIEASGRLADVLVVDPIISLRTICFGEVLPSFCIIDHFRFIFLLANFNVSLGGDVCAAPLTKP